MQRAFRILLAVVIVSGLGICAAAQEDGAAEDRSLKLGEFTLTAPEGWTKKEPAFRGIVLYEFAAPPHEEDEVAGRITIGPLGGNVDGNVQRWIRQIVQPDGGDTSKRARREEKTVSGQTIKILDMTGNYADRNFRTGTTTERKDYRMMVAMVFTKGRNYYVKFTGPKRTVAKHAKAMEAMLDSLK